MHSEPERPYNCMQEDRHGKTEGGRSLRKTTVKEQEKIIYIRPHYQWKWRQIIADILQYKDLLYFLVVRDIKSKYAQSILGIGWAILNPLINTLVFTVIFGNLAKVGSDGVPYLLFSFFAMVPWTYFSGILTDATASMIRNRNLITKVYFPRLLLPLTVVISRMVDFMIGMAVAVGLSLYYGIMPMQEIVWLPLIMLILIGSSLGGGILLSVMAVQFRDVNYALPSLIRVLMYAVPVVYPLSLIPSSYWHIYALNPMVGVIEGMRSIFLGTRPLPWDMIGEGALVTLILLVVAIYYFRKSEQQFADIV